MSWFARLPGLEVRQGAGGGIPASAGIAMGVAGVAVMNACSEEVPAAPQKTAEELEIEAIIACSVCGAEEMGVLDRVEPEFCTTREVGMRSLPRQRRRRRRGCASGMRRRWLDVTAWCG